MKAELISTMGTDMTVCNAARVSHDRVPEFEQDGTDFVSRQLQEKDIKLIKFLAKNNHFTPFTHCMITLRETVPLFVARQRFKHTVGFTYNEVSRRYVDNKPEFYDPPFFRKAAPNVKQGSLAEPVASQHFAKRIYDNLMLECGYVYEELLKVGVAPEQARMALPQSMFTSYYVTGSLYAFARAYNLRAEATAQWEIQQLALQWDDICGSLFPVSWNALTFKDTSGVEQGV
jgi:thymidylate synthase (FAD)